jgi:hypothetical protein
VVVSRTANVTTKQRLQFMRRRADRAEIGDHQQAMTGLAVSLTRPAERPA